MFWIYVPPIILIGAIIALVVILGKKSAEFQKLKLFQKDRQVKMSTASGESRLKMIWQKTLQILEKVLILIKFGVKKSEQGIAGLVSGLRARRGIRKYPEKPMTDKGAKIIGDIEREETVSGDVSAVRETEWVASEMIVKRKREEKPPVRIKEEPVPEDKMKEEALIHRIAENPRDIEAYRELGDYYMRVGSIRDAKDSFKMVLKLRPRDLKAKSSLREIEMKVRLGS